MDGVQVLGEGEGETTANLEAKAGTAGAASPLSNEDVRNLVDEALRNYGVATTGDVQGAAKAAEGAKGTSQVVTLDSEQWDGYAQRTGYILGLLLVMVALVGFIAGQMLGEAIVDGWR